MWIPWGSTDPPPHSTYPPHTAACPSTLGWRGQCTRPLFPALVPDAVLRGMYRASRVIRIVCEGYGGVVSCAVFAAKRRSYRRGGRLSRNRKTGHSRCPWCRLTPTRRYFPLRMQWHTSRVQHRKLTLCEGALLVHGKDGAVHTGSVFRGVGQSFVHPRGGQHTAVEAMHPVAIVA